MLWQINTYLLTYLLTHHIKTSIVWNALVFGLSLATDYIQNFMSDVGQILSEQGVPNAIKLDDVLVWGHSYSNCLAIIQRAVELFQYLCFSINFRKLTVIPSHTIEYFGVLLDSFNDCFSLTEAKRTETSAFSFCFG